MQTSSNIANLIAALAKAQAEIPNPNKDSFNPHHGNKFASLSSYIAASKAPLLKHGLVLSQSVVGDGKNIGVETMLAHTSGEYILTAIYADATMTRKDKETKAVSLVPADGQAIGSLTTYLRRYAIGALLNIVGEDDDDAEQHRVAKSETAAPAAPRQQYTPKAPSAGNTVQASSSNDANSITIEFGKYKGRNLAEVFGEDPKWVEWAANRELKNAPDGKPYRKDVAFTAACKALLGSATAAHAQDEAPDDVPF